jgi:hypothetical protein
MLWSRNWEIVTEDFVTLFLLSTFVLTSLLVSGNGWVCPINKARLPLHSKKCQYEEFTILARKPFRTIRLLFYCTHFLSSFFHQFPAKIKKSDKSNMGLLLASSITCVICPVFVSVCFCLVPLIFSFCSDCCFYLFIIFIGNWGW